MSDLKDKRFLASLLLVIVTWALVYQEALLGMEAIWARSDTFAHGYFILPISLWLIWRDKSYLKSSKITPTWLPLPLLAISLFVNLFAYAADINVLNQLSAVTSLIFILWALFGNHLAWRYKFPLVYLLFAVPMGENLIPWLQDVTAWFTVFFLKLNGIPVFVEGLYIQIPTGMFEVAVACSGIRYLIASAAVGALFGYLTYQKTYKQIIFFIFALCLPILANGIRAYGIVAIAYYSDMKYATGADHLVYGWLFFGLIIMLMFWIGGFFADKEKNDQGSASNQAKVNDNFKPVVLVTVFSLMLCLITVYLAQSIPSIVVAEENKSKDINISWGISFQHSLTRTYHVDDDGIEYFSAAYANKQSQGELVSSQNKLHDIDKWTVVNTEEVLVEAKPIKLVHLRSINGRERIYLYQYKVGDFYTVNKTKAKLMQAWNSLSRQSDISEFKAVSQSGFVDYAMTKKQLVTAFTLLSYQEDSLEDLLKRELTVE
ncbi:exosortase A [Colwelliaceae bacterium MEBiC 14330]